MYICKRSLSRISFHYFSEASVDERKNGLPYASKYLMDKNNPLAPITVVSAGQKCPAFDAIWWVVEYFSFDEFHQILFKFIPILLGKDSWQILISVKMNALSLGPPTSSLASKQSGDLCLFPLSDKIFCLW